MKLIVFANSAFPSQIMKERAGRSCIRSTKRLQRIPDPQMDFWKMAKKEGRWDGREVKSSQVAFNKNK